MFKTLHFKEKSKETRRKKYGVEFYSQTEEYKKKVQKTCMEKYGTTNVFKSDLLKNKSKQTCLMKYGCEYVSQSKEFQEKRKQNLKEKYGENYNSVLYGGKGNPGQSKRAYQNYILKSDYVIPLFSEEEYVEAKKENLLAQFKFKCKKCGCIFESYWDNGHTKSCPNCLNNGGTSLLEHEIFDFLKANDIHFIQNDRKKIHPLEIDAYIPNNEIGIEVDGLYWHSTGFGKSKSYHLEKTKLCEEKGIQLIHIFENEWNFKQDIVKSRLKNILGIYDHKAYARQCEIRPIDSFISREFQENNHIQGAVNASVNLGLYFNNELISLMTFGKTRFNKKYEWELLRFCNKLGWHVPGAATKLLKYFERNYSPKSIISYADRRWSSTVHGNVYEKMGFKLDHISKPDYWYYNDLEILESRIKYQKHKLPKLLKNFDPSKTEVQNMLDNGYNQIFDCGNLVYVKLYE